MSAMIASAIVADIDLDLVEAFRLNKVINDQDGTRPVDAVALPGQARNAPMVKIVRAPINRALKDMLLPHSPCPPRPPA